MGGRVVPGHGSICFCVLPFWAPSEPVQHNPFAFARLPPAARNLFLHRRRALHIPTSQRASGTYFNFVDYLGLQCFVVMAVEQDEFVFTRATTVHEALALVGIDGDATDPTSTAGTLAALWGADATTKVETLGELPPASFTEDLRNWRLGQNPAPLVLRGKAEKVGRLARAIVNPTPST